MEQAAGMCALSLVEYQSQEQEQPQATRKAKALREVSNTNTSDAVFVEFLPSSRWANIIEQLHKAYAPVLSNYLFASLRNEMLAQDVLQQTFCLFAKASQSLDMEEYQRWLYKTARQIAEDTKASLG